MRYSFGAVVLTAMAMASLAMLTRAAETIINKPPTAQDWADLAKLPDWSGVWIPNISDSSHRLAYRDHEPEHSHPAGLDADKLPAGRSGAR
jgi:hypothetical protein